MKVSLALAIYRFARSPGFAWASLSALSRSGFAIVALTTIGLCVSAEATAQTKRLAPSSAGQPWDACTDIEGFTVGDTGKFTAHSAKCNGSIQAWLLKQDNSHPGGTKSQLVLDHLNVRDLRAGEIFSAGPYCTANGREIRWLAIYDWKKRKRITGQTGGIVEAWAVNLKTERFEVAPASLMLRAECTANDSE